VGESYYELLGVTPDASTEAIEEAYREKLKETHPDVSDDENASKATKRLIEAKEVLTDDTERERYDRIGHEAYVDSDPGSSSGGSTSAPTGASGSGSGSGQRGGTATGPRGGTTPGPGGGATSSGRGDTRSGGAAASSSSGAATAAGAPGGGATAGSREQRAGHNGRGGHVREESWYDGNTEGGQSGGDSWRAWDNDGSYAVNRGGDAYQHGGMFKDQRSLILLLATFAVYPVLLFGALVPQFPLAVNLTVAMCVVLVIAFLQSVPEVGVAVFGLWSLLLPVTMFWFGVDLVSVRAFVAMTAAVFPFGLSLLTRVAIRPVSAT